MSSDQPMSSDQGTGVISDETVYVSWGGTGRAATLRKALTKASEAGHGLIYLAILDDSTFGDVDRSMLELAKDELSWLLDAQLELARKQTGLADIGVRVLVRSGDVAAEIIDVVDASGTSEVLIGAPIPPGKENAVTQLLEHLRARLRAPIEIIEP
ncbi:MAG: universal stress protein [Acidimicrobiales bacterium]